MSKSKTRKLTKEEKEARRLIRTLIPHTLEDDQQNILYIDTKPDSKNLHLVQITLSHVLP